MHQLLIALLAQNKVTQQKGTRAPRLEGLRGRA